MSNDKKRKRLIIIIAIVLVLINLIVFSILFLDLSKYIWPETNIPTIEEPSGYQLSSDGTITIDGITYKQKEDGNFIVISCESNITTVDILNTINLEEQVIVDEIGENAFEDCTELTQINIPSTIKKIDSYAFSGCKKLKTITLPYSVEELGDSCFINCTSLTSIKVHLSNPNFTEYNGVLYDIDGKKLYVYPYNKTDESYKLSDNLESIEKGAFRGFAKLKSVAFPENLKNIGESAFEDCVNLESVLIPKNVETIGKNAFANCSENIVIYGEKDSYAETYAKDNNITFKSINEWPVKINDTSTNNNETSQDNTQDSTQNNTIEDTNTTNTTDTSTNSTTNNEVQDNTTDNNITNNTNTSQNIIEIL